MDRTSTRRTHLNPNGVKDDTEATQRTGAPRLPDTRPNRLPRKTRGRDRPRVAGGKRAESQTNAQIATDTARTLANTLASAEAGAARVGKASVEGCRVVFHRGLKGKSTRSNISASPGSPTSIARTRTRSRWQGNGTAFGGSWMHRPRNREYHWPCIAGTAELAAARRE
jgi:hypothetical protein